MLLCLIEASNLLEKAWHPGNKQCDSPLLKKKNKGVVTGTGGSLPQHWELKLPGVSGKKSMATLPANATDKRLPEQQLGRKPAYRLDPLAFSKRILFFT